LRECQNDLASFNSIYLTIFIFAIWQLFQLCNLCRLMANGSCNSLLQWLSQPHFLTESCHQLKACAPLKILAALHSPFSHVIAVTCQLCQTITQNFKALNKKVKKTSMFLCAKYKHFGFYYMALKEQEINKQYPFP